MFILRYQSQIFITICVYIGQMLAGYLLSWTAPVVPKLEDPSQSPLSRSLNDVEKSLLASVIYITGFPGVFFTSWFANYKGRKPGLIIGAFVILISFLILVLATNFTTLLIGRLVTGLGLSFGGVLTTVYLGEITSTNIRGIVLTGLGIIQTLGSLFMVAVGPYVSYAVICYIGLIISAIYVIAMFLIPESPVFYVLKDDETKVQTVLKILNRESAIQEVVDLNKNKVVTNAKEDWKELFTLKCNRMGLFVTATIMALHYVSGILVISFFVTTIFQAAGSSIEPNVASIIIGCTQLVGSSLAPFFIERSGRRILLLISTAICCISMTLFGVYFYLSHIESPIVEHIKWLPLTLLIIFFLSNNMGFGTIPSTLTGEMFSCNVRSKGTAVVIAISWICGFTVTTLFNSMLTLGAHFVFWFFAFTCCLAFLFTVFFVPETKGKSLVEIQEMLSK
ncbi:facilitated trehalose transporter Tret1-like [Zerene cesonia]|uniref:facilitated trehalose transporter Tret1-like n=1 Tax=Zerene cesonia TaxID=33412 RepID=UPI0018E5A564|nr:facilitated trehalose transporter Tret1-like [Zerene cesonia]